MRTLRVSVMCALLSTSAVVAGVSAADDSTRVNFVSGTMVESELVGGEDFWTEMGAVAHSRGRSHITEWEWSDPRLPAHRETTFGWDIYPDWAGTYPDSEPGGKVQLTVEAGVGIAAGGGTWDFSSRGMAHPDGSVTSQDLYIGRGGYDGLFAHLDCRADAVDAPVECSGYIFEGDAPLSPESRSDIAS